MTYESSFGQYNLLIITEDIEKWKQKALKYLEISNFVKDNITLDNKNIFLYHTNSCKIAIIKDEKAVCILGRQNRIIINKVVSNDYLENIIEPLASLNSRVVMFSDSDDLF